MSQDDTHRTGCGCVHCGPPRRDELTGDWPDVEITQLRRQLARVRELVEARAIVETALFGGVTGSLQSIREVLGAP